MGGGTVSVGRAFLGHLRRLVKGPPPPPWFEEPPANTAQAEVRTLLGEGEYRALVEHRRITVAGSAGGRYTLWAARALRGAPAFFPRVFDEQRRLALCVSLEPEGRDKRAWEDEWHGLIRWIRCAEPVFHDTAVPLPPKGSRYWTALPARTSAEAMATQRDPREETW